MLFYVYDNKVGDVTPSYSIRKKINRNSSTEKVETIRNPQQDMINDHTQHVLPRNGEVRTLGRINMLVRVGEGY